MQPKKTDQDCVLRELHPDDVGEVVVSRLLAKGYCVVDAGFDKDTLTKALRDVEGVRDSGRFSALPQVVAEGLLGISGSCRVAELGDQETGAPLDDGENIGYVDTFLTQFAAFLEQMMPVLGFECNQRSTGLLHETDNPEGNLLPELTQDAVSQWQGLFMRGKIMVIAPLGPAEGKLTLTPYNDEVAKPYNCVTRPGDLILVCTDQLTMSHTAAGRSVLLSCSYLQSIHCAEKRNIHQKMTPALKAMDDWIQERLVELKNEQTDGRPPAMSREWESAMNHSLIGQQSMAVAGISVRCPNFWSFDGWAASIYAGIDVMTYVPIQRWNHQPWYDPDPNAWQWRKTIAQHMGYMDGAHMFDNKMFGITPAESKVMDPSQRLVLEVGYDTLYSAGMKKGKIMNSLGGMYCGYTSGFSDFANVEKSSDAGSEGSFGATGGSAAITANRFSFVLGMKGPSLACDLDSASGLAAVYLGCEALQNKHRMNTNAYSVAGGVRLNLAAAYWCFRQACNRLSATGRNCSFDHSADGMVHSDCGSFTCLKQFTEIVDNNIVLKEGMNHYGVIAGSTMVTSGKNVSLNAPNGPAIQEALFVAVSAAGISGLDVDTCECHSEGTTLHDAVECGSAARALRGNGATDPLMLQTIKSSYGHMIEAAGTISVMKILQASKHGAMMPNQHFTLLNPHLDIEDAPIQVNNEALDYPQRTTFNAVLAFGMGGANVSAVCWGEVDDNVRSPLVAPKEHELVWWPGGGGQAESTWNARKGFHVVGTMTDWQAEPMKEISTGHHIYTFTLGPNRWEEFTILQDADRRRILHPVEARAGRASKLEGPDANASGQSWRIEARTSYMWRTADPAEEAPKALADGDAVTRRVRDDLRVGETQLAKTEEDGQLYVCEEVGNMDRGFVGAKYTIHLQMEGKFRVVDWEKVEDITPSPPTLQESRALEDVGASGGEAQAASGDYFLSSNWNKWCYDQMAVDDSELGVFFIDILATRTEGIEFQIIRNRSAIEVLYPPEHGMDCKEPLHVMGPDDADGGNCWHIDAKEGETYRVELKRTVVNGLDRKRVSWTCLGSQPLREVSIDVIRAIHRSRLLVFGTWDDGMRMVPLTQEGKDFYFFVAVGPEGGESFQIVQDADWNRIWHPNIPDAGLGEFEILGPSHGTMSKGRSWRIGGKTDDASPGDIFEVRIAWVDDRVSTVTWRSVPFSKAEEALREGTLIRRR